MIGTSDAAALYGAVATVLVAVLGLIGVLVQQRRTQRKVDRVYDHVNRVEEQTGDGGQPLTFREEMRAGFQRNDADHAKIVKRLTGAEGRISRVEREVGLE